MLSPALRVVFVSAGDREDSEEQHPGSTPSRSKMQLLRVLLLLAAVAAASAAAG
jgi:hypothetical protein